MTISDHISRTQANCLGLIFGKDQTLVRAVELPSVADSDTNLEKSSELRQQLYQEMFNLKLIHKPENPFDMMDAENYDLFDKENENRPFEIRDSSLRVGKFRKHFYFLRIKQKIT